MTTPEQIKIWQLLWAEYRAGNNEKKALLNIIKKLGYECISELTISDRYHSFRCNDCLLFDGCRIIPVIQTLPDGNEVRDFKKNS